MIENSFRSAMPIRQVAMPIDLETLGLDVPSSVCQVCDPRSWSVTGKAATVCLDLNN